MSQSILTAKHAQIVVMGLSQIPVWGLKRILEYCKDNKLILSGRFFRSKSTGYERNSC